MPQRIKRRSDITKRIGRSSSALHRPSPRAVGYDADWDRVAKRRREADHWLCQRCLEEDRLTPANDVDHIIPLHVRCDWRLELGNTQVLCRAHHRTKTQRDNQLYGSSTCSDLTPEQQEARRQARQLPRPPRTPGGGPIFRGFSITERGVPCACVAAKLGRGV